MSEGYYMKCRAKREIKREVIGEVNNDKFGCYTPGSKIPIISEKELISMKPDYLLVLPWHFRDGIIKKEKD